MLGCDPMGGSSLDTVSVSVSLRPLRIGFLVDPRDRAAIGRVLRMATCFWGGMMCPLIPVMRSLPKPWLEEPFRGATPSKVTRGFLRFFEPDAFVETAPGQLDAAGLSASTGWRERARFRSFDTLVRTEPGRSPFLDMGVSMHRIYAHLFKAEFQFKKRQDPKILLFEGGDPIAAAFFEACYGLFPDGDALAYIREHYRHSFAAQAVAASVEAWIAIERGEAGYPLFYTVRNLNQRFEGDWDETIFVFDPLKASDVIDFWNLRLFTRDVMPVNVHWLAASRDLIVERIQRGHRPLPSNPNGVMIGTRLQIARSLDAKTVIEALDLGDAALPAESVRIQDWYEPIWMTPEEDRLFRPVVVPLVAKHAEVQLVPSERERSLRVPALSPDNVEFIRGAGPGWVNVVHTRFYGANMRYADAVPSAALIEHDHYPPRSHVVQIPTREGHVTFHSHAHDSGAFVLATMQEAISGWLKAQDIDAEPSDAGRVADQLIASVGGLWGVALLAHPEAIRQFDKMARSREIRANGDSEEYPDRTATIGQLNAMLREVQKRLYGRHVTLDRFVDAGVLTLGIAVRCTHCTKENWYSLDDIASTIRCERCLKVFYYPQGQPPSRDAWKYRVVGPFATPHFAHGSYAVALTLRFLDNDLGSLNAFTFSTSLLLKRRGETCETDFFAWHGEHTFTRSPRDPALLVGECKSFGTELFKAEDIRRLKRLGEMLPGAYLVAAALKPSLSKAEMAGLRSLAKWGWGRRRGDRAPSRLIVLTGTELFALGPFRNAWLDAGGRLEAAANSHPNIFDLDTLAQATQQAHLGFTDEEMRALCYPSRKKGPPRHARQISVAL